MSFAMIEKLKNDIETFLSQNPNRFYTYKQLSEAMNEPKISRYMSKILTRVRTEDGRRYYLVTTGRIKVSQNPKSTLRSFLLSYNEDDSTL